MKRALLLVICLYSCSGSSDENVEKATEYGCENKLIMVQADSSLHSISFELSDSIEQTLHKLDTAIINDCGPYFPFKWQNRVYEDLKLTLFDPTRCISLWERFSISIRINKVGMVLLADSTITQDVKLISSYIT